MNQADGFVSSDYERYNPETDDEVVWGKEDRIAYYGPYNSETHEPTGYYDVYIAEFGHNDIEYQIVAEGMEVEEVVKVAASIITGERNITLMKDLI